MSGVKCVILSLGTSISLCVCVLLGVGERDAGLYAQLLVHTHYIHRNTRLKCTVILFKHTF